MIGSCLSSLRTWIIKCRLIFADPIAWIVRRFPFQLESNRWTDFDGTWLQALKTCEGYADSSIADIMVAAAAAADLVPGGWDRDGKVFTNKEPHWPLVAAIQTCRSQRAGSISVLDFGGGTGSILRQHRTELDRTGPRIDWLVVEQEHMVKRCSPLLERNGLRFASSIPGDAMDVAILACVLNYLEDPYEILRAVSETGVRWLILDRVPLAELQADQLQIQSVHPKIYSARYPCWLFSRKGFMERLGLEWEAVLRWEDHLRFTPHVRWEGGLFRRVGQAPERAPA